MTSSKRVLPSVPHPDHLRKQAKARLAEMRSATPSARLGDAQHLLAREYGFAGWAALQAEVARRSAGPAGRRRFVLKSHVALLTRGGAADADDDEAQSVFVRAGAVAQLAFLLAALSGVGLVMATMGAGWSFDAPPFAHHRAAR